MKIKFNLPYHDEKLKRDVKKDEVVEMAQTRADQIVKDIKAQAKKNSNWKAYEEFSYEKIVESKKETEPKQEATKTKE
ncbi:hypothetical protein [Facklamia sp. P12934]|uniref:hypothetical protein n=1 Tax=unclassified Facklamia TaxID=2622293 RepID=UPI003D177AAC